MFFCVFFISGFISFYLARLLLVPVFLSRLSLFSLSPSSQLFILRYFQCSLPTSSGSSTYVSLFIRCSFLANVFHISALICLPLADLHHRDLLRRSLTHLPFGLPPLLLPPTSIFIITIFFLFPFSLVLCLYPLRAHSSLDFLICIFIEIFPIIHSRFHYIFQFPLIFSRFPLYFPLSIILFRFPSYSSRFPFYFSRSVKFSRFP